MTQVYRLPTLAPCSLPTPLSFSKILHVPVMSKNLISVSALCVDNPINVLFFESFFQVSDRHTRMTLVRGQRRDGFYYWPKSVPLQSSALVLPSSARSSLAAISMWLNSLGHPSLLIFRNFLSVLSFFFLEKYLCSFSYSSYNMNKSHKLPFSKSSITSSSPLDLIFSNV